MPPHYLLQFPIMQRMLLSYRCIAHSGTFLRPHLSKPGGRIDNGVYAWQAVGSGVTFSQPLTVKNGGEETAEPRCVCRVRHVQQRGSIAAAEQ